MRLLEYFILESTSPQELSRQEAEKRFPESFQQQWKPWEQSPGGKFYLGNETLVYRVGSKMSQSSPDAGLPFWTDWLDDLEDFDDL